MKKKANTEHVWSFIHVFNQPNDFLVDAFFFSQGTIKGNSDHNISKANTNFLW